MTGPDRPDPERRLLVLAPTARDAEASRRILTAAGVDCFVCKDLAEVCSEIGRGGGAALLTQEAILSDRDGRLVAVLARQPRWSDFPLIVLTPAGPESAAAGRALEAVGPMTLVKRPVPIQTLVSTVRAALRDRLRQYAARDDLARREEQAEAADHRTRQLQRLAEVFSRLNAAHDVRSVLGVVTDEARNLIGAHQARTVMTPDPDRPQVVDAVSLSDHYAEWRDRGVDRPGAGGGAEARLDGPDAPPRTNRSEPDADPRPAARGWLAVPLVARDGRGLGQIQLSDRYQGDFTENDEALLVQLAQMASAAVENARLYEELRTNDRRKDEFLAMLAHELRNPLAAINNAVRVSTAGGPGDETGWSMGVIGRQVKHLSRLIDDLLDVSRITGGKIQLRKEVIDPYPVLAAAVEAVRPLAEERRHEIITSFGPCLRVDADPTRLEQILVNLLTNSAKYTESGGHIWLTAGQDGDAFVVTVRDDGVGIPPEKLPRMFDLFAQGDRTLARSEGGLGIGLTLVRSLAEMHGGTVTATSGGDGCGSEFVVRLPCGPAPVGGGPAPEAQSDRSAAAPARILIVDDDVDTARGMAKILTLLGHNVRTAHDGRAAVAAAEALLPEFVLLDIGLPGMNGFEVAAKLRGDDRFKSTVIIAVSGYGQDDDRRRSKAAGFDYHLVKPLDHDDLLTLLSGT